MNGTMSDENNKFLAEWKPTHDQGAKAYIGPYLLKFFLAVAALIVFLFIMYKPQNMDRVMSVIATYAVLFVLVVHGRVTGWYKKEKKYEEILALYETINKCPACSEKISPEDKTCPACGVTLGI